MKIEIGIAAAIKVLASKITDSVKADDALKFTQAALNLAHADAVLTDSELRMAPAK